MSNKEKAEELLKKFEDYEFNAGFNSAMGQEQMSVSPIERGELFEEIINLISE